MKNVLIITLESTSDVSVSYLYFQAISLKLFISSSDIRQIYSYWISGTKLMVCCFVKCPYYFDWKFNNITISIFRIHFPIETINFKFSSFVGWFMSTLIGMSGFQIDFLIMLYVVRIISNQPCIVNDEASANCQLPKANWKKKFEVMFLHFVRFISILNYYGSKCNSSWREIS